MDDLKALENKSVDLSKVMAERKTEQEIQERAAFAAAVDTAQRWDRAMQRAFKGIVSRPHRHRMLRELAAEREAAQNEH